MCARAIASYRISAICAPLEEARERSRGCLCIGFSSLGPAAIFCSCIILVIPRECICCQCWIPASKKRRSVFCKNAVARKQLRHFSGIFRYSTKSNTGILLRYFSVFQSIEYLYRYRNCLGMYMYPDDSVRCTAVCTAVCTAAVPGTEYDVLVLSIGVPPVRLLPGDPAGLPGRVLPATGSGSDPTPAWFFGPSTPEYPGTRSETCPSGQHA